MPWTWDNDTFDFVHLRYLCGGIADWNALMAEAYRCCKPGGWMQTCECDPLFLSDDGTTDSNPDMEKWRQLFDEGSKKLGQSFTVIKDNLQRPAIEAAGLVEIHEVDFKVIFLPSSFCLVFLPLSVSPLFLINAKVPVGGWAADPQLAEVGRYLQLTMENDLEGRHICSTQ